MLAIWLSSCRCFAHGGGATVDGARCDIISMLGKRVTVVTSRFVDAISAGVGLRQLLLRVSDAGRSQRCGLHRGRRPKAFNEGTRGKLQAVAPRAPRAMGGCATRSRVSGTHADGGGGWRSW